MANSAFFREVFDELAVDGCIGDPKGVPAYAYVRVSSSGQADEGRSGLPRQIRHIHEAAEANGYQVSWDNIFADDHTGFDFKNRPQLTHLRQEYKRSKRRADAVIIENLDRLSRNADWHQGFLLDEMQEYGLQVVFWKSFSSRIERAVMGAISQDGMEEAKRRMMEGNLHKARGGRVTARQRAYGYIFVDSEGRESLDVKKDTYYAPHPEESQVVELIFRKIAEGESSRSLSTYLQDRFPPPKNYRHWAPKQITLFIRNPLYKGEFIAHRYKHIKVPKPGKRPGDPVKLVERKIERPKSEWIVVPVPPLVSKDLWNLANRMLDQNARMSPRNAKQPYLLTGLVQCATCGNAYHGTRKTERRKKKIYRYTYYRCTSRGSMPRHMIQDIGCKQGQIACHRLDDAVWSCICQALLEPEVLLHHIEQELEHGEGSRLDSQIRLLKKQLEDKELEDEKLYRAYVADVFDENEYAVRRQSLNENKQKLVAELERLTENQTSREQLRERRDLILAIADRFAQEGVALDAPFEIRQRIIRLIVDNIILNKNEGWFTIEGVIPGTFSFSGEIASIPADRGLWPQPAQNSPER